MGMWTMSKSDLASVDNLCHKVSLSDAEFTQMKGLSPTHQDYSAKIDYFRARNSPKQSSNQGKS